MSFRTPQSLRSHYARTLALTTSTFAGVRKFALIAVLSLLGTSAVWAQVSTQPPRLTTSHEFEHSQGFPAEGKPDNVDRSWLTKADDPRLGAGLQIQRTHVTERTVYYMPGTELELIPFADFPIVRPGQTGGLGESFSNYMENYLRWYNYATDKKDDRLKFKPMKVRANGTTTGIVGGAEHNYAINGTEDYTQQGVLLESGYFGGAYLTGIRNSSDKAYNVTKLNGNIATFSIPDQTAPMDDAFVAFDLSRGGKTEKSSDFSVDVSSTKLTEPIVTFRIIWTLKDARPWADSYSASQAANRAYIQSHVNKVTARAGHFFQVRLDHSEPVNAANPSDYWYKKADNTYAQVMRYRVETWRDGVMVGVSTAGSTPGSLAGGYTDTQCAQIGKRTEDDALVPSDRFLMIKAPREGTYTIKIFGLGAGNARLQTADNAGYLQLEEYELNFVDESNATLLLEHDLKANHPEQTKEYLKSLYGEPRAIEDFDSYVPQDADGNYIESYSGYHIRTNYDTHSETDPRYSRYYKWPIPWGKTSYGRTQGNAYYGGHNVYLFINHTAPLYPQNASNYTGQGYDRLYYDTGGGLNVGPDDYIANTGELKATDGKTPSIVKNPAAAKHGWMLWINAAGDPGRIIDLDMGSDICVGSRIHVSAWTMETSNDRETANLMFKFYGVKADGSEELLNTYVSGYVPGGTGKGSNPGVWAPNNQPNDNAQYDDKLKVWDKGQWMHIYYNFTADASMTSGSYDHYILTLENNCTHSGGADVCVDDIEVFLETPSVEVQETEPICAISANHVKVNADFDRLLASQGMTETTTAPANDAEKSAITYTTWYCFVDKANYEAALDLAHNPDPSTATYQAAFAAALVGDATADPTKFPELYPYHHATFYTYYAAHENYSFSNLVNNDLAVDGVAWKETQGGKRYLVFNTSLTNANLKPGREYYVFFHPDKSQGPINADLQKYIREYPVSFFELGNRCAIFDDFIVTASNLIKVDGEPHPLDGDKISVCAGERPNIRVDMVGVNKENLEHVLNTEFTFDWYYDTYTKYTTTVTTTDGKPLAEALTAFRANYPDATTPDVPAKTVGEGTDAISYTEADRALLMQLVANHKLDLLRQSTNIDIPITQGGEFHMVIIPVIHEMLTTDILYCLNPQEVVFVANDIAPTATDGFGDMKDYKMDDVPVRINLKQLEALKVSGGSRLVIPIYNANPTDDNEKTKFIRQEGNTSILLVDTNDPAYRDKVTADPDEVYPTAVRLPEVGNLLAMDILMARTPSKWHRNKQNCITINFADDFQPREGFYYTLKAKFVEVPNDVNPSCPGDIIIPLKIVPLYQKWTGAAGNDDWNNDLNWTRADKTAEGDGNDLMHDGNDAVYKAYATNADNGTAFCYAPMRDTRVQMAAGVDQFPTLYANNFHSYGEGYKEDVLDLASTATDDIEFDMVVSPAFSESYTGDYMCVPYYQNNCREVHFGPDTEMLRTDLLTYDRAWVEYSFAPDRWYTIGSPLKGVYAGDMYMPTTCTLDGTTIGARQLTPLYRPITFDNTLATNDRFRPAVYQRSWDKAVANVYRIEGDGMTVPGANDNPWNVAVRGSWSYVYNDATVDYSNANGFSIKADVARLASALQPSEVLMRLPKDDSQYIYYTVDKETDKRTTPQGSIDRTNNGRLLTDDLIGTGASKTYTIQNQTPGRMFLVANPFMSGLDIDKFFARNANSVTSKLWVVSNNTQVSYAKDPTGQWVTTDGNPADINMLQSFFVEGTSAESTTLNVTFTPDMMISANRVTETQGNNMHFRSETATSNTLHLTLERNDEVIASAAIVANAMAHNSYEEREDAMLLLDSNLDEQPTVYTVADGTAMSINTLREIGIVPIGTICADDDAAMHDARLTFTGVDSFAQTLYLYNAETNEMDRISEGMSLTVPARCAGKYFITTDINAFQRVDDTTGSDIYTLKGIRANSTRNEQIYIQGGRKVVQ